MQEVHQIFSALTIPTHQWTEFTSLIETRHFIKDTDIKKCNQEETFLNIVVKGSVGLFICTPLGDVCTNVFYEQEFFCDYLSLIKQEKTVIKSVALEDTGVWSIPFTSMRELYARDRGSLQIAKQIAEHLFVRKHEEQIDLLTLSPEERYLKLLQRRPDMLRRTSLKIIASTGKPEPVAQGDSV